MAEPKVNRQDLYGQVRDLQKERRGYAARRGVEQLRRVGGSLMGQSSKQLLAGAPAEFQAGMTSAEKMEQRSLLAEMMGNLSEIEANLANERSVSRREMQKGLITMAGNILEFEARKITAKGGIDEAKITGQYASFSERMRTLEAEQSRAGFYGKFNDRDQSSMQGAIKEEMGKHMIIVRGADGGVQMTEVYVPLPDGSVQIVQRPQWKVKMTGPGGVVDHEEALKSMQNQFMGLDADKKILWIEEFGKAYPGVNPKEWLVPGAGSSDLEGQAFYQALEGAGISAKPLVSAYAEAEAGAKELKKIDSHFSDLKRKEWDGLLRIYAGVGADPATMKEVARLHKQAEMAANPYSPQVMWVPPPQGASREEKEAYLRKEFGDDRWTVNEDGTFGMADEEGVFHTAGGENPVLFEDWAASEAAAGPPPGMAERSEGTVSQKGEPSGYTETSSEYIKQLWKELNQPERGSNIEEFLKEPSFLQWMKDMNYGDENSSELDKRWAARQLIKEARLSGRDRRGERRDIRDRNIVEGKALSTPGQMRRAQRRRAAVMRQPGEAGTDSAQVASTGTGGTSEAPSALPEDRVDESIAATGAPQDVDPIPGKPVRMVEEEIIEGDPTLQIADPTAADDITFAPLAEGDITVDDGRLEAGDDIEDIEPPSEEPLDRPEREPGLTSGPTVGAGTSEYHTGSSDVRGVVNTLLNRAKQEGVIDDNEADTILQTIRDPAELAQTIVLWARDKNVPLSPGFAAELARNIQPDVFAIDPSTATAEGIASRDQMLETETAGYEEAPLPAGDLLPQDVANREAVYEDLIKESGGTGPKTGLWSEKDVDFATRTGGTGRALPRSLEEMREQTVAGKTILRRKKEQEDVRRDTIYPDSPPSMSEPYETEGRKRRSRRRRLRRGD